MDSNQTDPLVVPGMGSDEGATAEEILEGFIARFTPEVGAIARDALRRLTARLPGAVRLVYDNYNGLVIGFGPTVRPSEAILSIAVMPRWVDLCFLQAAATLPDPAQLLQGTGSTARHVVLKGAEDLELSEVSDLIDAALARANHPIDATQPGPLIIKSVSAKQRPRQPSIDR
jgi:hypothetical protein